MYNKIQNVSSSATELEEDDHTIKPQSVKLEDYFFPSHRLKTCIEDGTKEPVAIIACGSFSPITYLHLRIFEMAKDYILENTNFEIIGGYYSPVSDHYQEDGLAPSYHRVRMCELAVERTSTWLMVDAWETLQDTYTRTALVLDHFKGEINEKRGGVMMPDGKRRPVKILLLAGGNYGVLIVERTGSDVWGFLLSHDMLYKHRKNVYVIKQLIYNDISSTKVR
ncbi:6801_t:CDS:2 [Entrophospora sp. SA101]|nr:6801_t:CDS:2 [Entrophospora sp. SA101]